MPHTPQTALVRLIQGITPARNIAPGDRVAVRPHVVLLTDHDAAQALDVCGGKVAPGITALVACRDSALQARAAAAGLRSIEPGCELAALIDQALIVPGECAASTMPAIAALGGMGALGLRLTPRDLGRLLAGHVVDITVPGVTRLELAGARQAHVAGRDVFHALRRELRVDNLAGCALEISGPGLAGLALFERAGLCSLASQAGLFAAFCTVDRAAVAALNADIQRPYAALEPEKGAAWLRSATLDLAHAVVTATPPEGVDAARGIAEFHGERIDQVIIGGDYSCGIEVLRHLAAAVKQRKLHTGMVCDVVPDSPRVAQQAAMHDLLETLADHGVKLHPAGTPPATLLQPDRKAVLTTISAPAGVWRVGPFAAAIVACAGMLAHPERIDAQPQRDSKLSGRRPKPG
ncbi:MAG: hypothetical protein KF754_01975 [Planctomycetes bacterium]|nr:hypothetical protein [Planctomycetota bacterium]